MLDDHRRSVLYRPPPVDLAIEGDDSYAPSAHRYDVIKGSDDDYYDEEDEAINISIVRGKQELLCDDVLPHGWYRFLAYGMSRDMASSCPGPGSCGTVAPVWLDMTTRQNLSWNSYSVDACVSWGFGDGGFDNFDCCLFTLPVQVKQCKGFRVYYLGPTQACDIAYCSAPVTRTNHVVPAVGKNLTIPLGVSSDIDKALLPRVRPQKLLPPTLALDQDQNLRCSHSCPDCRIKWIEILPSGERKDLDHASETLMPSFKHGYKILCQIDLDDNVQIEESSPFPLGITFDPNYLQIIRNSQQIEVSVFQHVPVACDQPCPLRISFISRSS